MTKKATVSIVFAAIVSCLAYRMKTAQQLSSLPLYLCRSGQ